MEISNMSRLVCVGLLAALTSLAGCDRGPELGTVKGKVTQNGVPVPFAYLQFTPVDPPGTYGSAYSDADGNYSLKFSRTRDGAPVGKHEVLLRTSRKDEIQVEDKSTGLMVTPKLPEGYKANVELVFDREVFSGNNEINFDLKEGVPAKDRDR
jgi:hypothetical protein